MEASLHDCFSLVPVLLLMLIIVVIILDKLATVDIFLCLELGLLLFSLVHLHLDPQIHVLVHLIHWQIHAQPCFLDQYCNFPNVTTDKYQLLVDFIDGERRLCGLLVDELGVCVDEHVGQFEVFAAVLEDFFEGNAEGELVRGVANAVVQDYLVVNDAQTLVQAQLAETDLLLYGRHLIGDLLFLHFQELEIKLYKALLRHRYLLFL